MESCNSIRITLHVSGASKQASKQSGASPHTRRRSLPSIARLSIMRKATAVAAVLLMPLPLPQMLLLQ